MNAIRQLGTFGQSVWLDHLDRKLISSGELARMINEDGIRGVTSNPTIFEKAIASGSHEYADFLQKAPVDEDNRSVLERLMVRDLTDACDALRVVYNATDGMDGFASIEVSPSVANDTAKSVEEATRLWKAVNRPNLMVKIPGTRAGLLAVESCLAHGININVTLLFSVARYREIVEAFLSALETRVKNGEPIDRIASVASFFVSRVDTAADKLIDKQEDKTLRGRIAIANAKLAYEEYERIFANEETATRWNALKLRGAKPQRLLWASTAPKDKSYDDLVYIDALIGQDTVDTMPLESIETYMTRGQPAAGRITSARERAHDDLKKLAAQGISLDEVTNQLEEEGVSKFAESYEKALEQIKKARKKAA